ncbi:MAG: hypothetical protein VYD54_01950 [Bdellovibrionota bacterium]|nr:hypothetical protein [Bdellovibrionota bacterium]
MFDKYFLGVVALLTVLSVMPVFSGDTRGPASSKGLIKVAPSTENVGREVVNGMIK